MVRTRFAPSPTGYLHIGGVRTALYNWLFSRQHGGRFILRIDDTDAERNVEQALEPILHGFRWLGIDWDEGPEAGGDAGPYFQSQRQELYHAAVDELIARGAAYRDYALPEELEIERQQARDAGVQFVYSRRWAAHSEADEKRFEGEGRRRVVRLRMPRRGFCRFNDRVRGDVEFEWAREQDHVIQRADGSCLYHLASAVDDHEMGITHVIRAEEHLSNTPRHIFIAESLGYPLPEYAHLPYVAEPGSKTKLSKRKLQKYLKNPDFAERHAHGRAIAGRLGLETAAETFNPVIVDFYEQVGYLPEALLNYLLLLGWALDDKTEIFSREEMVARFSLERVQKSPASFDPRKLWAFQDRYMQTLTVEERSARVLPFLAAAGIVESPPAAGELETTRAIVAAAGDRIKAAGDVLDYTDFFVDDERLDYDAKAFDKRLVRASGALDQLTAIRDRLTAADDFSDDGMGSLVRGYIEDREIALGQVVHALRIALTGKPVGFGLFEAMSILGRDSCLARIDRAVDRARARMDEAGPEGEREHGAA